MTFTILRQHFVVTGPIGPGTVSTASPSPFLYPVDYCRLLPVWWPFTGVYNLEMLVMVLLLQQLGQATRQVELLKVKCGDLQVEEVVAEHSTTNDEMQEKVSHLEKVSCCYWAKKRVLSHVLLEFYTKCSTPQEVNNSILLPNSLNLEVFIGPGWANKNK